MSRLDEMRPWIIKDFLAEATIRQIANRHKLDYKWVENVIREQVRNSIKTEAK